MKELLLIVIISILFASCGVKEKPEYNSQVQKNNNILYII